MALTGIGDALFGSGRYEEAIRRYRIAQSETATGVDEAIIGVKMALCEHALGREKKARGRMRDALAKIPLLSGWVGREEEFYHSMSVIGIGMPDAAGERIFLLVGPVESDFRFDDLIGPEVPVREIRREGGVLFELGPMADAVEAMIVSEKIRTDFSVPVEILTQ
jgi:hypothetical protein